MIQGAIFDVDGTLLDSMKIWEDVSARYLRSLQVEPEKNLSKKLEKMSVEEGAQYLKTKYALPQSMEEIVHDTLEIVQDFYFYEAPLKPGAREMLESLRQAEIPMVVATSSVREHVERAFARLHILEYFSSIFTCSEVGVGKTQPIIYEEAGRYLGKRKKEIYVFEDAIHALETAKKAGFYTVAVYDASSQKDWEQLKQEADLFLTDLRQFQLFEGKE